MSKSIKVLSSETCDDQIMPKIEEIKNIRAIYTLKQVSDHDSWDDCWIVIYDRVYDITKFLELVSF